MLNDFRVYGVSLSKDLFLFFVTEETFIFAGRMCDCIMQGKVFLRLLALCGGLLCGASLFAQQVRFALNAQTGAVDSLFVEKAEGIKWLMRRDGSQYKWITADYGWGLGYFTKSATVFPLSVAGRSLRPSRLTAWCAIVAVRSRLR